MKEKQKHREAFEHYAAMGPGRSLARLAQELQVSESTVKGWSRDLGWADKLEARSREVAETLAKTTVRDEVEERKQQERIVDLALFKTAKALAEDRIKPAMSDVGPLIRLKQALQAEGRQPEDLSFRVVWPSAEPEVTEEDRAAQLDDARAALREEVQRREREAEG